MFSLCEWYASTNVTFCKRHSTIAVIAGGGEKLSNIPTKINDSWQLQRVQNENKQEQN